jgi:hypothetical protein
MERVPVNEKNRPQQDITLHKVSNVDVILEAIRMHKPAVGDDPRESYRRRANSVIWSAVHELAVELCRA